MIWPSLLQILIATLTGYFLSNALPKYIQTSNAPNGTSGLVNTIILLWICLFFFPFFIDHYPITSFSGIFRGSQRGVFWAFIIACSVFILKVIWSNVQAWHQLSNRVNNDAIGLYRENNSSLIPELEKMRFQIIIKSGEMAGVFPRVVFNVLNETPFLCATWTPILSVPLPMLEAQAETHAAMIAPLAYGIRSKANRFYSILSRVSANTPILGVMLKAKQTALEIQFIRDYFKFEKIAPDEFLEKIQTASGDSSSLKTWEGVGVPTSQVAICASKAGTRGRMGFAWLPIALILSVGYATSWAVGSHDLPRIVKLLGNTDIVGWKVVPTCNAVVVKALVGEGGDIPDGLVIDASKCKESHICGTGTALIRNKIPKGDSNVQIQFLASHIGTVPTMAEIHTLTRFDNRQGLTHFKPLDLWSAKISPGLKRVRASIFVGIPAKDENSGSGDLLYGPIFHVVSGSILQVSKIEVGISNDPKPFALPSDWEKTRAWLDQFGYEREPLQINW